MSKKTFSRKLSFNERLYMAGERMTPPASNQVFFDGTGTLDTDKWQKAVDIASEANPGSRLTLKGGLFASRWVDSGISPPVREVDAKDWDGESPQGISFIYDRLPLRTGPTCEVLFVRGKTQRVCFRTHHSVMDGRGTMLWIEDIFRALRGETPMGSDSTMTDFELARSYQKNKRVPFPFDNLAPTGKPEGEKPGVTWRRATFSGKYYNLVGQVTVLSAKEAWRFSEGKFRVSMPIDMRPHKKGIRSTGNLTMPIYVEVTKETTPKDVTRKISYLIRDGAEAMLDNSDYLTPFIPVFILSKLAKKSLEECNQKGLFRSSGVISNLGHIPLKNFSGGGFTSTAFWTIPPSYDLIPFFVGLSSQENQTHAISVAMPNRLASDGRIEAFTENIIAGLEPTE